MRCRRPSIRTAIVRTILFALELGGGWGHLGKIQPLARELVRQGHRVFVATPQVAAAATILREIDCSLMVVPATERRAPPIAFPRTFAHVLLNTCLRESVEIAARCATWQAIFAAVQPDAIVCEHAPGALLAARETTARVLPLGHSFTLPDAVPQLPDWRPRVARTANLEADERRVLDLMNTWLVGRGLSPLAQVSDLYHDTHAQLLATYPALDSYAPRRSAQTTYFGIWPIAGGAPPQWPAGPPRKILAYLKPCPALPLLLEQLRLLQATSLVVCPQIDPALARAFRDSNVAIVLSPVDLPAAISQCDVAIGHGTHGFTACALAAGRPQVMLPLMLEQRLNATCVKALGAGQVANPKQPRPVILALRTIWENPAFATRAQTVANTLATGVPRDPLAVAVAAILGDC